MIRKISEHVIAIMRLGGKQGRAEKTPKTPKFTDKKKKIKIGILFFLFGYQKIRKDLDHYMGQTGRRHTLCEISII